MSAHIVYDTAPRGGLVRYSDGTPRPPARFAKKLAAWERRNGLGRLVRKEPPRGRPAYCAPASIILNEGNLCLRQRHPRHRIARAQPRQRSPI